VSALSAAVVEAAKAISTAMGFHQEQPALDMPRKIHSVRS
jgi:hypothetical protein